MEICSDAGSIWTWGRRCRKAHKAISASTEPERPVRWSPSSRFTQITMPQDPQNQSPLRRLSLVLTAFDEAETVEPVVTELLGVLDEGSQDLQRFREAGFEPVEVVIVDDGSRDVTGAIAEALAEQHDLVRCVRHLRNRGKSAALVTGVRAAQGDWILTLDADGQNNPKDFPGVCAGAGHATSEPILVCGRRTSRADTKLKHWQSRIANAVRRSLLHDETPDTGCGIKLFPRAAFLQMPHFHNMHRFFPALFLRQGGKVRSTDVTDRPRLAGTSKFGLRNRLGTGIVDLLGMIWLTRRPAGSFQMPGDDRGRSD